MPDDRRSRKPSGTPQGGQFAANSHSEPTGSIGGPDRERGTPESHESRPGRLARRKAAARWGFGDDLESAVTDQSWLIRSDATLNPALSNDQARRLAQDPNRAVRTAMACAWTATGANETSHDPDPFVRIRAMRNPYLSVENRRRLWNDPELQRLQRWLRRGAQPA